MAKLRKYKKGLRTQLTKNFWSTEFDCHCKDPECQWTTIDLDHVEKLQKRRSAWRKSVKISSGYRCPAHNARSGGSSRSRHIEGDATDIIVKGKTPNKVADSCETAGFNGIGRYLTFTHIDSRNYQARWDFTKKK